MHSARKGSIMSKKSKSKGSDKKDDETKKRPKDTRPIPVFFGADKGLVKHTKKDFPKTRAGKLAFCDYMVAVYQQRKVEIAAKSDPKKRLKARLEKAQAKVAQLQKELTEK